MRVIGTAGHVDHGKSTLVAALTGIHPDRLKEEQEREMTIDLGFAWLTLPVGTGNELVGVVDVPGHRDFIENMLAGVGGIDAALFVVAADEGVMPQTREHLAILDILQVPTGLVALTKSDLVDDEWLEMVIQDVRLVLQGTVLQDAPILPVSARNGEGLERLKNALGEVLRECPPRLDYKRPRLPVDRVFTVAGFGTVATGTLLDGQIKLGDEVQVLPGDVRGRVRSLQSYKKKAETAIQGSRVAVNISGVDVDQVRRGNVLAWPGTYQPTRRMDVSFRLLPDATQALKHGLQTKLYLGAAEVQARIRLLGVDQLLPGEEGWLQLELDQPLVAVRGDRYILRRPSPGETLGGGEVVEPHPTHRHKRFDAAVLEGMVALNRGTPAEVLLQAWMKLGPVSVREGVARAHLSALDAQAALEESVRNGQLVLLDAVPISPDSDGLAVPELLLRTINQQAETELERYHQINPLRRGMPREEFKSRLRLSGRVFNAVLARWTTQGTLVEQNGVIYAAGHVIRFTPQQQAKINGLLAAFRAAPYAPPSLKESQAMVGEDVMAALIELGKFTLVSADVVFATPDFENLVNLVSDMIKAKGALSVAELRDKLNTSRKYVLALLENLDAQGLTVREGDVRRWKGR